eukprot:SAG22_NODE_1615_length_3986_cov_3.960895_4_plen_103_part_00
MIRSGWSTDAPLYVSLAPQLVIFRAGDGVLDKARSRTPAATEDESRTKELSGDDFLHDFVANQGWLETKATKRRKLASSADDLDVVDAAEKFERDYNFRFEE